MKPFFKHLGHGLGRRLRAMPHSRFATACLLSALLWMVAAASFAGFISKWGLFDGDKRNGVEFMLDASAEKPFLYRQLIPTLANLAEKLAPEPVKASIIAQVDPTQTFARTTSFSKTEYRFRYIIIYYLSFLCLFISLFILRQILLDLDFTKSTAIISPAIFLLAFPYLQTIGGYYYDSSELLFLGLAFLAASRGKWLWLLFITVPATLNKETFIFFIPMIYPQIRSRLVRQMAINIVILACLSSGLINILVKYTFRQSKGSMAELHLFYNIKDYFRMTAYDSFETTYGIYGPKGLSILTVFIISLIGFRGWPGCPVTVKQHFLLASMISFPLFWVYCAPGELRNLSFLYIGFIVMIAKTIERKPFLEAQPS